MVGLIDTSEVCKPDSLPGLFVEFIDSSNFKGYDGCNGFEGYYNIFGNNSMNVRGVIGTLMFYGGPIYYWNKKLYHCLYDVKSIKIQVEKLSIQNTNGYISIQTKLISLFRYCQLLAKHYKLRTSF